MNNLPPLPVINLHQVSKTFTKPYGEPLPVLVNIDVSLREGEILGLLGRSGYGKSTLLRIAGGLIKPSSGEVLYRGVPLAGPADGIAVVFQSFALYPWLTVLDNVELGLDAQGLSVAEARRRANAAIDLIGLDGFQSAYHNRQRAGRPSSCAHDAVDGFRGPIQERCSCHRSLSQESTPGESRRSRPPEAQRKGARFRLSHRAWSGHDAKWKVTDRSNFAAIASYNRSSFRERD